MPKYEVVMKDIEIYKITVEADDERDAEQIAYDKISYDKGKYHDDSDGECRAYEID